MNVTIRLSEEAVAYILETFEQTPEEYIEGLVQDIERQRRASLVAKIEAEELEKARAIIQQKLEDLKVFSR